ncbi:MAG: class I SAM-dependent methyltransferase [Kitasatospora sp.]|jgi:methyltransferase (TIGR00027 family)|nr:class I SAM-dependent methyltransferase [Kitasatospora sp.]
MANHASLPTARPSRTALMSAAARAAHLLVDREPAILADTLAQRLLGEYAEELLSYHRSFGAHPVLAGARTTALTRSRFAEDRLAALAARGTDQYVLLGAGLDTFAYRSAPAVPAAPAAPADRVRVFEVDHPAVQHWKRDLLAAAGIAVPPGTAFVPVDLERGGGAGELVAALVAAGFDPGRPALVAWLGVTMYLGADAIGATLAAVGGLAPGSELVAEYLLPPGRRDEAGQAYAEQVASAAAEGGEPWRTFLDTEEMDTLLTTAGLRPLAHLRQHESVPAELWQRADALRPFGLSVLAHAEVPARERDRRKRGRQ